MTDSPQERVSLVRRVVRHLKSGGSILTFPSCHNEPYQDVYPGAIPFLQSWTDSVGVFVHLAPETAGAPVCVRGVSWAARGTHHPFAPLRGTTDDRQLLASAEPVALECFTADVSRDGRSSDR